MATGSRTKSRVSKAEQSRATRRRIVTAATTLFLRDGFLSATMTAIAKEAGVAVQTLYLSFTNKTAILSAAFDTAVAGDDEPVPIIERDWYKSLTSDPSGPASVASFFEHSASIIERSTPLYAVIRAASAEPEVAELLANNKRERHAALTGVADRLALKEGLPQRPHRRGRRRHHVHTQQLGVLPPARHRTRMVARAVAHMDPGHTDRPTLRPPSHRPSRQTKQRAQFGMRVCAGT